MSETPVSENTYIDRMQDSLVQFTTCVGASLDGVCSYSLTIGETYIPFEPDDEDCDANEGSEIICTQAWVRVMNAQIMHVEEQSFSNGGCASTMGLSLEVGVLRCIEVPEKGEAPTETDVMAAALQSIDDMNKMYCAAMNCGGDDPATEVWSRITAGTWVPMGPLGGQYGGVWTFDVEL